MITLIAVLLLLAASSVVLGAIGKILARPIPIAFLALFATLSLVPFAKGFRPGATSLPLEHVTLTTPWLHLGSGPPKNPYLNDVASQMLPWTEAVRRAFAEGSLPLRDRWNGAGMALAANGQSAAFSPFTLLALALPLPSAYLAAACLKLLLAASGMWLWTRELSASRGAAVFAAVAYAFSMAFAQWIFFPQTSVLALWPWILFLMERARDRDGGRRAVALLIAVLALSVLAGHPETLAVGIVFAALWIAARYTLRDLDGRQAGTATRTLLVGGLGAAGLTAFLLLPTLFAIGASNRAALTARPHWDAQLSFAPHAPFWRGMATAFFPRSIGDLIHTPQLSGATGAFPEMALGYFGLVGWAAALLVLRPGSPRRPTSWALLFLMGCGLAIATALWPFAEIFGAIPILNRVFPLRFYCWIALAGPALAALELDRYVRDRARGARAAWSAAVAPAVLGVAAVAWFLHVRPELTAEGALGFQKRQLAVALGLLGLALVVGAVSGARGGLLVAGLATLGAADLLYQWRSHYRAFPSALFYPETPLVRHLRAQSEPGRFRVAGAGTALYPNTNVFAGVEDIRTHDPVERRDYVAFLDATAGFPPGDYFKKLGDPGAPSLDFLNVRSLVVQKGSTSPGGRWRRTYAGDDGEVYENPSVLARAFIPRRVRLVAGTGGREPRPDANAAFGPAFADIARNRDFAQTAWILAGREGEAPGGDARISGYREWTNGAAFDADAAADAWVVLSLVQDGGWSARDVAGKALPLFRANGPFLAIHISAGKTSVRLRYRPPGFVSGSWISAATLLLLGVMALRARRSEVTA